MLATKKVVAKAGSGGGGAADASTAEAPARQMSPELIAKTATHPKVKGEGIVKYLARLTHLRLEEKRIRQIENLQFCPKLCTLYLGKNLVQHVTGLHGTPRITHVYLEHNELTDTAGFEALPLLQKLVLDHNRVSHVSGLERNPRLKELYLSHQKLPQDGELTFDEGTLQSLRGSLEILKVAQCHITDPTSLAYLGRVQILDLSGNRIAKAHFEGLAVMLENCERLTELNLALNPVCKEKKYRDNIILQSGRGLSLLDGKAIQANQRDFLQRFADRKRQLHTHGSRPAQPVGPAKAGATGVAFGVAGATVPHGAVGEGHVLPVHTQQLPGATTR